MLLLPSGLALELDFGTTKFLAVVAVAVVLVITSMMAILARHRLRQAVFVLNI